MAAEALTEEDTVALREAFSKFDQEESDHVKTEDVGNVLRAVGQAPTETELEEYKKEVDPKDAGQATFQAVAELYARIMKSTLEMDDELQDAFRTLDKDKDGVIPAGELRQYLTTLGEKLSEEEIDELIKDADTQGDGKINYEEFVFTVIHDSKT